ncbi:MAG: CRISPR-associated endonuclease Cas2 [Bryobacterales bacterium]|nr:CRISPR-associated endonuclease Cas2 [Bryobacterales bacterium]
MSATIRQRWPDPKKMPSEYRAMWLLTMFDLPMLTKEQRRDYTRFRKLLLSEGFIQLQLSVYARFSGSEESVECVRNRIRASIPPHGQVRMLAVTDHQYGRMELWFGRKRKRVEDPPVQFELF